MGPQLAKIGASKEILLTVDSDHKGICVLDVYGQEFTQISDFLQIALEETRIKIKRGSPKCRCLKNFCQT